jgi:hypothetical protein
MRTTTKNWGLRDGLMRRSVVGAGVGVVLFVMCLVVPAAGFGAVAWSVRGAAQPTQFLPAAGNRYQLTVSNTGSEPSSGELTLTDRLPAGLTLAGVEAKESEEGAVWSCVEGEPSVVSCTFPESLPMGGYAPSLALEVSAPSESPVPLTNTVDVTGGGAAGTASTAQSTLVGTGAQSFGITEFSMEARNEAGEVEQQAGGHPWQVTTSLAFPWMNEPVNADSLRFMQVENIKKVTVELPAGMVGNLLTTEHCADAQLSSSCPPASRVGTVALAAGYFETADYHTTTQHNPTAVYNMASEPGYAAVLGFSFLQQTVYLYATVVHSASGDRVRLTAAGVPPTLETGDVVLTLWGEPGAFDQTDSTAALITNPVDCSAAPDKARLEVETWGNPGVSKVAETTIFKELTGCSALQAAFTPGLVVSPLAGAEGTRQADSPSGFEGIATVPQTLGFEEKAVPEVRNVSATLPAGVSLSPGGAQGLVGCQERGPEGINLGTSLIGQGGRDEGNPEATEFGAGHAGGNGSPYDDDQYHTAPRHCPPASTIGSLEVFSPLLETRCGGEGQHPCEPGESPAPLQGHVYLAQPKCGGPAQPVCTAADAEDGSLFSGYVEVSGDGVLVKEPVSISVDQATGLVSVHLKDLADLPFSKLRLWVHGGQRAALATPQVCGAVSTVSSFTPWSGEEPFAPSPSSFVVDADGAGGACPGSWPFAPGFTAGSVNTTAGGYTAFTTTLTRKDREQDPTGLTVNTPLGLTAMLSSVTQCPEPQAAAGDCPSSSLIGHDTAGAGSGSEPYYVHGRVYLTGPYKGAPFGLDVVTPAAAGPFNLGNIVVRATINVNPITAQVTIASDPIPQSRFGIPLRLKLLNITVDRENFVINPTNCTGQQVTASTTGDLGATSSLSSPFAVAGCTGLKFTPKFSVSTSAHTSKQNGASLHIRISYPPGSLGTEAWLRSAKVELPKNLPSRLTTLQKACTAKQFESNPAGCPAESVIGHAIVHTEVLPVPLEGPAYFVSHGGEAFPNLIIVLQGYGVTVELVGDTLIKNGVTSSTFASTPDVPFESFELTLPQGKDSALAANGNLCQQNLLMPTAFTAQNGATLDQDIHIEVEGCYSTLSVVSTYVHKRTVVLVVYVPGAGKLTVSGKGVGKASKSTAGREAVKVKLHGSKGGKAKIKLSFSPRSGKHQTKTITVKLGK